MEDLSVYSEQLNKAIKSSQCFPFDLNCDALASQWYEAKKYFIEAFEGKPIVRFKDKIKIELSQKEQDERFQSFLSILNNEINISDEYSSSTVPSRIIAPTTSIPAVNCLELSSTFSLTRK